MKTANLAAALLLLGALVSCSGKPAAIVEEYSLSSPDGSLLMQFTLDADGVPRYSLSADGTPILKPGRLGFELRGTVKARKIDFDDPALPKSDERPCFDFDRDFILSGIDTCSFDETWHPVWGEESSIRNHYNELLVHLVQKETSRLLDIRFRLFDDGLGFRYEFPDGGDLVYFVIKEELTEFAMASDYTAWWIPGDFDTQEYEYEVCRLSEIEANFMNNMRINDSQTFFSKSGVQTSLQMKGDEGYYVNIHEAALVDYPCMHLLVNGKTRVLRSFLTPDAQGWKGYLQTPCKSPWRTVQVARSAEQQLASRLVLNLNEPCAIEDVSWIHPVKYMGVWWEMIAGAGSWSYTDVPSVKLGTLDYSEAEPHGRHSANNENVRKYIDFAAEHGFDALLVEGWNIGWEDWANCSKDYVFDFVTPYPDFDLAALNDYAHSKGIRLVMHHETSSSVRNYERHLEQAYSLMNEYGYDAVKSGYVGDILPRGEYHFGQWMVNHYLYAVTEAARHHIMVNAHEAVRPTGLCRTYPNLIGNESAMGTEYQAFGGIQPKHTTILPFTRLNGGPMDYTPGIFEQNLKDWCGNDSHVNATIANQLGLYLTMYSPLQMAADTPEHYSRFMDAFQFIKDVAVDWEESRYLCAEPGDYVIVARKAKGSGQWFCGGVTDENAREFEIPLDFLPEGTFTAKLYADAPDAHYLTKPQAYTITEQTVSSTGSISVRMAPGGGFAISFEPCK
ncbi:MAG: glycoside hydrolase family 97 protein [Candidatus Cryptobacteroides sp.]